MRPVLGRTRTLPKHRMPNKHLSNNRGGHWFVSLAPAVLTVWVVLSWVYLSSADTEPPLPAETIATPVEVIEVAPSPPPAPVPVFAPVTAETVYRVVNSCVSYGWDLNNPDRVLFYECAEGGFTAADIVSLRASRVYENTAMELNARGCFERGEDETMDHMGMIGCPEGIQPTPLENIGPYTSEIGSSVRLEDCRPVAWSHYSATSVQDVEATADGSNLGEPEPVLLACGSGLLNQTYMTPLQRDNELAAKNKTGKKKVVRKSTRTVRMPVLRPNSNIKLPRPPKLTEADKAAIAETLSH